MPEFKFSDIHLSNLLMWQIRGDLSNTKRQDVFWIKPIKSGTIVHSYESRKTVAGERFQFFKYCPNAQ
jgi:hypothetical protein